MTHDETLDDNPFVPLFDGVSLSGWRTAPRIYGSLYPGGPSVLEMFEQDGRELPVEPEKHPAHWLVEDGVLDSQAVLDTLGARGHIALEVHDNDSYFGEARWGVGAQCRWRNIRIKELNSTEEAAE